jgi:hypothetical protein
VVAACGINVGLDGMGETSLGDLSLRESGDRQVRILVVEDDSALQRMILNYFGENNIHTLERFDVGRAAPARDAEHGRGARQMSSRKDIVLAPWPTAACRQRSWLRSGVTCCILRPSSS